MLKHLGILSDFISEIFNLWTVLNKNMVINYIAAYAVKKKRFLTPILDDVVSSYCLSFVIVACDSEDVAAVSATA